MSAEDGIDALVLFIARRLRGDLNTARAAGHGVSPEHLADRRDWTALDLGNNVRADHYLRFLRRFSPQAVGREVAHRLASVRVARERKDPTTLRILAAAWAASVDDDPLRAIDEPTPSALSDALDALARDATRPEPVATGPPPHA